MSGILTSLKGLVGLSSEDPTPAPSGLVVESLPDISPGLIGSIGGASENRDDVWSNIEDRAILKFKTLFFREINECHKIRKSDVCDCFIDENAKLLATALWYLLGAEVMFERIYSVRLNRWTTLDRTKAKDLRAEYMDAFQAELSTAVAGIDIHDSECVPSEGISENDIITTHYTLP